MLDAVYVDAKKTKYYGVKRHAILFINITRILLELHKS
jgi:hypothetical protein